MRVVMVCRRYSGLDPNTWSPSGTPAVLKMIEEFERRGHRTTVLLLSKTPERNHSSHDYATDYGRFLHVTFNYVRWRGARWLPAILSDLLNDTRQFLRTIPYLLRGADLLYFDRAHLGFAALASLFSRRVVWRCLGVMSFLIAHDAGKRAGTIYLSVARLLMRFPIRLMICTNDGSPWFRVFPHAVRDRLLLLTNGIDRPVGPPRADRSGRIPVIGFVGRATVSKGLDLFAETCVELSRRQIPFHAVVVGDGDFRERAMQMAHDSGVAERMDFRGGVPHERIGEQYGLIDIYVTPARNGAFSNTMLEALAAGCCVVALSPARRTGVDRTTMAFLPPELVQWADRDRPVSSLADRICDLLVKPEQRAQIRARNAAFAQELFASWPERIALEADLLEQIANGSDIPSGALPGDRLARKALEVAA